jgi:hypothetical protein
LTCGYRNRESEVLALAAAQERREAELSRAVLREGATLRSHSTRARIKSEIQSKLQSKM